MRSATAAEWILALVTTPDRAASTAGDLMEGFPSRGDWWFWSGVLRTASSHVWRDVSSSPLRTLWHAIWGVLAISWFTVALGMAVTGWVRVPIYYRGAWGPELIGSAPAPWGLGLVVVAMATAVPTLVGWEVARRSAGRELAAALSAAALCVTFDVVDAFAAHPWPGMRGPLTEAAWVCSQALFLIAGAILFRRRALAEPKSAA